MVQRNCKYEGSEVRACVCYMVEPNCTHRVEIEKIAAKAIRPPVGMRIGNWSQMEIEMKLVITERKR